MTPQNYLCPAFLYPSGFCDVAGNLRTFSFQLVQTGRNQQGEQSLYRENDPLCIEKLLAAGKEMTEAYADNRLAAVKSVAHRIKPMIDNLGITALTTEVRQIEKLAGEGKRSADLEQNIRKLDEVIGQVVEQLRLHV